MPQASESTVWMGVVVALTAALAALLACALGSVLAALGQMPVGRGSRAVRHTRPDWHAATLAAALAGAFSGVVAAGVGISAGAQFAAIAGAVAGASLVRRRNLTRRPALVALLASGMGLAIVFFGVARCLSSANHAPLTILQRMELYTAVFAGALIFATSAIAFCKLRGLLPLRVVPRQGHDAVNAVALLLCAWLGYGFVTEAAQPFGLAALLATSALASSIGVHVMLSREYSKQRVHTHGARGGTTRTWGEDMSAIDAVHGIVRAAAFRHGPRWHNSGNRQRDVHACAARRFSTRSATGRQS